MQISEDDLIELKRSWERLRVEEDQISQTHYDKLFTRIPGIEELFTASRKIQAKRLIMSFDEILRLASDEVDKTVVYIMNLGMRHKSYQAKEEHYAIFKEVLLETFSEIMGEKFTVEEHNAWDRFIEQVYKIMIMGSIERQKMTK